MDLTLRPFDDQPSRQHDDFEDDWRAFLHAWNLLQFHPAGVAAVSGEYLERVGVVDADDVQYIIPSQMAEVLGTGWGYKYFITGGDAVAAASRTPIAAGLFAPGVRSGHVVVLEPTMAGFLVRDPLPGVTYHVGADWVARYVAWGVGPF